MSERRNGAMDAARGIAVAGMVVAHFVSLDGFSEATGAVIEGTPAALFFVLIGMSWAIQADRSTSTGQLVVRRSLALLGLGVLLHLFVWPTEVLVPFAIMLAPALAIRRFGRWALVAGIVALLGLAVLGADVFARYSEGDWLASGAHLADSQLGWVTVRYLLFDGNYPAIPWLAFPLLGMLFVRDGKVIQTRMREVAVLGIALGIAMWGFTFWSALEPERFGEAGKYFATSWVPTTIPFMLLNGGIALGIIGSLSWWGERAQRPLWGFTPVGRASLTHYLGHLILVFLPLRYFYPGEDWPVWLGGWVTVGYLAAAVPLSIWWFRGHTRGPAEAALARISGPRG